MKRWVLALTGATGVIFAQQLLYALKKVGVSTCLVISNPGQRVARDELGWQLTGDAQEDEQLLRQYLGYSHDDPHFSYFDWKDIGCCLASGSFSVQGMFIIPCSMATLAGVAHGMSRNLIERAADVTLKERRRLIIVPRETPFNAIHLRNMLTLAEMGADIVPPLPAFYHHPKTINDLVRFFINRILNLADISSEPSFEWNEKN